MKIGRKLDGLAAGNYLCLTGVYDKISCTGSHPLCCSVPLPLHTGGNIYGPGSPTTNLLSSLFLFPKSLF